MDKPLNDHGQFHDRKTFDKLNEFIVLQGNDIFLID